MRFTPALILLSLIFVSCQKDEDNTSALLANGVYTGTFSRTGMDTASVTLNIYRNRFDGSSDKHHYPALCGGSYEINDETIIFSDTCAWTADFDWSLITDGNYFIDDSDDQDIRIWKTNEGITDEYLLRRLVR